MPDVLLGAVLFAGGVGLTTAVHELGHALALLLRGIPIADVRVGDVTDVRLRIGRVRIDLGRWTGQSHVGGYVSRGEHDMTAKDVLVFATAGPAASAAGTLITAALAWHYWGSWYVTAALLFVTTCGLVQTVGNLVPSGELGDDEDPPSDGRVIQLALAELRRPARATVEPDPHAATSFGPPVSEPEGSRAAAGP